MSEWAITDAINYAPNGDTIALFSQKTRDEFILIYNLLNRLRKADASAGNPSDTTAYQLHIDTVTNKLQMRNANNTGWIELGKVGENYFGLTPENISAVKNTGTVGAIYSGKDSEKAKTSKAYDLYFAFDTKKLYYWTGTAWELFLSLNFENMINYANYCVAKSEVDYSGKNKILRLDANTGLANVSITGSAPQVDGKKFSLSEVSNNDVIIYNSSSQSFINQPKNTALSEYAKTSDLAPYAKTADVEVSLSGYTNTTDLNNRLANYALTSNIENSLSNYEKTLNAKQRIENLKTEVETSLSSYEKTADVNNKLSNYALTADVETKLMKYSTTQAINNSLESYVTQNNLTNTLGNYSTTNAIKTSLLSYAREIDVQDSLSNYSTTAEINASLASYPTNEEVLVTLSGYTNTTNLNTKLADYAKTKDVAISLSGYTNTINLNTKLAEYAKTSEVESSLSGYLPTEDIAETLTSYTKTEDLNSRLTNYALKNSVKTSLANYEKITNVNSKIASLKSEVEVSLSSYEKTFEVDEKLSNYALSANVETKFLDYSPTTEILQSLSGYTKAFDLASATVTAAKTAKTLETERKIAISGDATGSAKFDGGHDVTINLEVNRANAAGQAGVCETAEYAESAGMAINANHANVSEACNGHSATANRAAQSDQDGAGRNIVATYATKKELAQLETKLSSLTFAIVEGKLVVTDGDKTYQFEGMEL